MGKLIRLFAVVYIAWFFVGKTEFKPPESNLPVSENITVVEKSNVEDAFFDRDADFAMTLSKHTVKIREDITVKDIRGNVKRVENASAGSGTVIDIDAISNTSLILTAEHVCTPAFTVGQVVDEGKLIITSSEKSVITIDGTRLRNVEIVNKDFTNDICVIKVVGLAGYPAGVSVVEPPINATIYTAGAPTGTWNTGAANVVNGRYSGVRTKPIRIAWQSYYGFCQYSLPIVGGMSGSAVYYKGVIVGILTIGTPRYEHLAWGPDLKSVAKIVKKSREEWLQGNN